MWIMKCTFAGKPEKVQGRNAEAGRLRCVKKGQTEVCKYRTRQKFVSTEPDRSL